MRSRYKSLLLFLILFSLLIVSFFVFLYRALWVEPNAWTRTRTYGTPMRVIRSCRTRIVRSRTRKWIAAEEETNAAVLHSHLPAPHYLIKWSQPIAHKILPCVQLHTDVVYTNKGRAWRVCERCREPESKRDGTYRFSVDSNSSFRLFARLNATTSGMSSLVWVCGAFIFRLYCRIDWIATRNYPNTTTCFVSNVVQASVFSFV